MDYITINCDKKMIPDFDEITGYLPPGCYKPTIKEFEECFIDNFPDSTKRLEIFKGYIEFSIILCDEMTSAQKQLINGSFTTNKIDPGDMDLVIIFDSDLLTSKEKDKCFILMNNETIKEGYGCHSYPLVRYPKSKPELYAKYLEKKAYWLDCWGSDKEDIPKGIIDIDLDKNIFIGCKR